jgi:fucokinase
MPEPWDYLIVTASNEAQARAYELQLGVRRRLGLLDDFREVLVVADPQGKRVGSGGSTIYCLLRVLEGELPRRPGAALDRAAVEGALRGQRILILHAGGDSRRLPAYAPCGKIFVPVPGPRLGPLTSTVFDHLLRTFAPFPAMPAGCGQVVVAAGDALIQFDVAAVRLAAEGLTALGCYAEPEQSRKHGVFCAPGSGPVRFFLQKPSPAEQARRGALNRDGRSILDVGVMSFDGGVALSLLQAADLTVSPQGALTCSAAMHERLLTRGLDIYREVCCALGTEATPEHLIASARASGSTWDDAMLGRLYAELRPIRFHVQVLAECSFLHFGTTRQLIGSGRELLLQTDPSAPADAPLCLNTAMLPGGAVKGGRAWIEGCRLGAPLLLAGDNVVIGVDLAQPLSLPAGACLDVMAGRNRDAQAVWFVRCYHLHDTFKDTLPQGATFCGRPLGDWLAAAGARPDDVWDPAIPADRRSLWDARVFPAVARPDDYRAWLWMFHDRAPSEAQQKAFLAADRYSMAEMATLADQDAFHDRRAAIAAGHSQGSTPCDMP